MKAIDKLVNQSTEWLKAEGPENEVVVSSRLRLARNLEGFPFLQKLKIDQRRDIIRNVGEIVAKSKKIKSPVYLNFSEIEELDRQFLLERHLISREHAVEEGEKALAMTPDEVISIMVLEEDHLRMQAFQCGLNLTKAWEMINAIDDDLEKKLRYSFSPNLGYLTACPTNVGTGLRASCMLHLPGLVLTKQVHKVLQALAKLNLAARGLYGEGTQATGNLFQFSNQMTLGQKEDEIIDNLERVLKQVVEHEKEARSHLREKKTGKFEDQMWRALGTLRSARIMTSSEATQLLSLVQLGMCINMIQTNLTRKEINSLFLLVQPAHLQKTHGKNLESADRDRARADLIREKLATVQF